MAEIFAKICSYENGKYFRQEELENYYIDYIEAPSKTHLIIVFDGSDVGLDPSAWQRLPWGAMFFESEGFSLVGVKTKRPDWYRGEDLHNFFMGERFQEFIKGYENICLYGNSMGGYAALAFAGAIEGAKVLSCCPQSTLDTRLVPWDNRYPYAREQNWDGHFADASKTLDNVAVAYVLYDPFFPPDRAHVKRLPQDKIIHLKAPFLKHDLAPQFLEMDLLKPLFLHFIEGDLETWFPKAIRVRKFSAMYEYNALLLWSLRLYERGARENAKIVLRILLGKNPGDQFARTVLQAINKGQKINRRWQVLMGK